jgi:hypothetical protein
MHERSSSIHRRRIGGAFSIASSMAIGPADWATRLRKDSAWAYRHIAGHQLPGSAYGIEAQWARGHWSAYGELQKFLFTYRAINNYNMHLGYAELRRVLRPRWYLADRASYRRASAAPRAFLRSNW